MKEEEARAFAAAQALPLEGLHRQPALLAALQAEVDAVNARHARVANNRKFAVLEGNFSVAAGELTATMKLRRKAVIEAHREIVEGLYREGRARVPRRFGCGRPMNKKAGCPGAPRLVQPAACAVVGAGATVSQLLRKSPTLVEVNTPN